MVWLCSGVELLLLIAESLLQINKNYHYCLQKPCMHLDNIFASEMTYCVSGGALNSTHSLLKKISTFYWNCLVIKTS